MTQSAANSGEGPPRAPVEAQAGRPVPVVDSSAPFWDAARQGRLAIQRCVRCRTYQHPPKAYCRACLSSEWEYADVSGRATVYSYTQVASGARHPFFVGLSPYVLGVVELVEQERLLMYTNFTSAELPELRVGAEVQVVFDPLTEHIRLPQFRLAESQ